MTAQRLKLRVLAGVSDQVVRNLTSAVERTRGLRFVAADDGEVWDPTVVVAGPEQVESASQVLGEPRSFDARLVLALEGVEALSDPAYWELRSRGFADLLDLAPDRIEDGLRTLAQRVARWGVVDQALSSSRVEDVLVGRTPIWARALRTLIEAAIGTKQPVLVHGETGTGKEAAARLVHDLGPTSAGEFVVVDCASIVESLSGSELFGHRRGAFTGADRDRDGAILRADGGTLFLDELGELKPGLQAELLRVLQEGTWRAVGGDRPRYSTFRLVAATNRDLAEMVRLGRFRSDLYYRIASTTVNLPPLRARLPDVPLLVRHFLRQLLPEHGPIRVELRLERLLQDLPYDGNVRQLRSIVQTLVARYDGSGMISSAHLPPSLVPPARGAPQSAWSVAEFQRLVEEAIHAGETFRSLVDACKDAACQAALRKEGSARRAARVLAVSTRMVEKRRRPEVSAAPPLRSAEVRSSSAR
jgi:transcriptional regulator with GAF, ATPase, and Fis domain